MRQRLWGCYVKFFQVSLVVVALCFAAVTVRADSIPGDGRILVGHGSDPGGPDNCGLSFKIHLNGKGGGIKNCQNTSGVDWIGLEIFAVIPQGDTVNCVTSTNPSITAFSHCSPPIILSTFGHKEHIEIVLSGGIITSGSLFFINLNTSGNSNTNGAGGWSALVGGNLDAHAITPEPGSLLLLISGGVGFYLRRKPSSLP